MSAWRPPQRPDPSPLGCGVLLLVYVVAAGLAFAIAMLARHGL